MSVRLDVGHSVKRVALLALVVLAMGGAVARRAAAEPNCKPNRATCRTNGQCCSGVCTTGLCSAAGSTTSTTTTTTTSTTLPTACGDGTVGAGEQCDDGNSDPGDGCFDCHIEHCGNGVVDFGEECDGTVGGGPYGCTSDCFQVACGNGRLDPGEECDDGNQSDDDRCLSSNVDPTTCTYAPCGAGTVLVGNECQPDYTAICGTGTQLVAGQCVPESTCPPSSCGDGVVDTDAGEACDDGNVITETECPYGTENCTGCSADCSTELMLTGPFCGDGTTTCPEVCDDGNDHACGTCSASCSTVQLASATGLIVTVDGASLVDGEGFTLDDGVGTAATFEFDLNLDDVGAGNIAINVLSSDSASSVATRVQNAINDSALQIDATAISNLVSLAHQRASSLGNQPIAETVAHSDFNVAGMAGGAGGDCQTGVACITDNDCASGDCGTSTPGECD